MNISEVFMKMYGDEYKNANSNKKVKEKENKLNINQDKTKENTQYIPFLEKPKDEKQRVFIPNYSLSVKRDKLNFTPLTEIPKEKKKITFTPDYTIDTKKNQRSFTPFFEMPKKENLCRINEFGKNADINEIYNDKKDLKNLTKNPISDYKSQGDLKENYEDKNKLRELDNEFNPDTFNRYLLLPNLKQLYNEYHNLTNLNANSGLKFTQKFKKFLEDHNNLTGLEKEQLKYTIEKIENENQIEKYILNLLSSTTYKIEKIIKSVKEIKGLTTSYATVKNIEKKYDLTTRKSYRDSNIHPNLIKDYFKTINNKDKAYFLGFLYADGWITLNNDGSKTMGINLHPKDEYIINHFIKNVKANISKKTYYTDNRGKKIVHIDISDQEFCNYLLKQGVKPKKTLDFDFPKFRSREQSLSFLLGFFDGDGTQGTTKITSGNRKFLYQIKEKYQLNYKIAKDKRKKNCYNFHLGAKLFNEMLDNYKKSLPRKRIKFCTEEERLERVKSACIKNQSGKLSNLTKKDLEKLVWKIPFIELGKLYGCSGRSVSKKCDKFGIQKPPPGYWKRKRSKST